MKLKADTKEFELHPDLYTILLIVESQGFTVVFTDLGRSFHDHVRVYKELEKKGRLGGKHWYGVIPLRSRHLPSFKKGNKLRACDFYLIKDGKIQSGKDTYLLICRVKGSIKIGAGVGREFMHLDVDRAIEPNPWYYSY